MSEQVSIDQMVDAVQQAHGTIKRADMVAGKMAGILRGRLRSANIPSYVLCDLKRELANFNMHTGQWKP